MDAELQLAKRQMLREHLRRRGIYDRGVLQAIQDTPRERFVAPDLQAQAYADTALGIDCGQTITQPYLVALMTEALNLTGSERVLEIGTGSGYQTAILSALAARVVSIERHAELSAQAGRRLAELGCSNVRLIVGDGTKGCPDEAPYDRILVTAAAEACPPALLDQLAEGGVLVIPVGSLGEHELTRWEKRAGKLDRQSLGLCRFVPLVSDGGAEAGQG